MFDVIHDAHFSLGHLKVASTFNKISETYCNITENYVRHCLKLCYICILANDSKRTKHKGPGVSIKSKSFRERIQFDLIDYQNDPRKNHNGVVMRWLMVVKDHFTKFMWLRPLARKQGVLVAAELRLLFHEVGFPLIFHTDNGKEFINNEVYFLMKNEDPNMLMVRGAPRTPRHQGSVENGNQHIKVNIDKQIEVLRTMDPTANPGWVEVLGPVTSAMNSSVCYGNHKLTAYRHVFTQDFEFKFNVLPNHIRNLTTIDDLKTHVNDPTLLDYFDNNGYDRSVVDEASNSSVLPKFNNISLKESEGNDVEVEIDNAERLPPNQISTTTSLHLNDNVPKRL